METRMHNTIRSSNVETHTHTQCVCFDASTEYAVWHDICKYSLHNITSKENSQREATICHQTKQATDNNGFRNRDEK